MTTTTVVDMTESGSTPQRLLPCDVVVSTPGSIGRIGFDRRPTPPSYNDIVSGIAPADDPDKWFSASERSMAAWLRSRGLAVRSVQRREGRLLKTPDAVAVAAPIAIEIKGAIGSVNSIVQRIREGRWQARHVVVDVRGTDATRATAETALHRALIKYKEDLDEVAVLVTDNLSVGWFHG